MGPKIQVEFAKNPAVFQPGEKVEGKVVVTSDESFKARAIEVRYRGKAHNEWYDYARRCCYCQHEYYDDQSNTVWPESGRSENGDVMPAGRREFPFNFKINDKAPCTFEGVVGWIRYTIFVKIDNPTGRDICKKEMFTVVPEADLNKDVKAQMVPKEYEEKKQGFIGGRPLLVEASCDKGGYVPGEVINVLLQFKNESEHDVTGLKVKLVEKSTFHGKCIGSLTRCSTNTASKIKEALTLKGNSTGEWRGKILIPSLPPSDLPGCSIINLQHKVKVVVICKKNIKVSLPIRIGTVPLLPKDSSPTNYPPPSYTESVFGPVDGKEKEDPESTEESAFTPLYAYYDWGASPYAELRKEMDKVMPSY